MTCFNCYSIHADQYSSSFSKQVYLAGKEHNFMYSCYYCNTYQTDLEKSYERHVILTHPKRPAYPSKVDLETRNTRTGKEMGNIVYGHI